MVGTAQASVSQLHAPASRRASTRGQVAGRQWLTREQLAQRVELFSPSLVGELYTLALRQLDAEDKRKNVLHGKAGSLLGQTGMAITIAGSLCGLLLSEPELLNRLSRNWLFTLGGLYLLVFGIGTFAALSALWTVRVRGDYEEIDEAAVFDPGVLGDADAPVAAKQSPQTDPTTPTRGGADENATASARYQRWMIPHLWSIYQAHNRIHERKARWLGRAQLAFALFVIGVALLVPLLSVVLLLHPAGG